MDKAPDTLRSGTLPPPAAVYDEHGDLMGLGRVTPKQRAQFESRDIDYAINNVRNLLLDALAVNPVPWVPFSRVWAGVLHRGETTREALDLLVKQGLAVHNKRLDHYRIKEVRHGKAN